MADTVKTEQEVDTSTTENKEGKENVTSPEVEGKDKGTEKAEPYKTFTTREDFDKHSAGILNSAKNKAEKELLAMLGLKPDEKDKLAKFKEAYDSTLSESEKQAKTLESLNAKVNDLESQIAEKDCIISALTKTTGKSTDAILKYVKMARGLVDENTTIEQALDQVFSMAKMEGNSKNVTPPSSKPLNDNSNSQKAGDNPFKSKNYTEQARLMNTDIESARKAYTEATGKLPPW